MGIQQIVHLAITKSKCCTKMIASSICRSQDWCSSIVTVLYLLINSALVPTSSAKNAAQQWHCGGI